MAWRRIMLAAAVASSLVISSCADDARQEPPGESSQVVVAPVDESDPTAVSRWAQGWCRDAPGVDAAEIDEIVAAATRGLPDATRRQAEVACAQGVAERPDVSR